MLDDGIIAADGQADEARLDRAYLMGLKGIGPYAAAHCALLLHDFRHIPIDTVALADLRERYGQNPDEFAASRAAWGEYLALGYKLTRLRARLTQDSRADCHDRPVRSPRPPDWCGQAPASCARSRVRP